MIPNRTRGVAVVTALLLLVVVAGVTALMLSRTVDEVRNTADDAGIVQTLLVARGAVNLAGAALQSTPVQDALGTIVNDASSTTSPWSFGEGGDVDSSEPRPEPDSVAEALSFGSDSVAARFQQALDGSFCDAAALPDAGGTSDMAIRVHVTASACGEDLPAGVSLSDGRFVDGNPRSTVLPTDPDAPPEPTSADQTYSLPYAIVAEGTTGPYRRSLIVQGEFRFTVGRASFAQYALFTNRHQTETGLDIWFTDRTLFDGPVHTNERFRFYRSPWFGGRSEVTSAGCRFAGADDCVAGPSPGAFFYGEGFRTPSQMETPDGSTAEAPSFTNRFGTHAPTFQRGVSWQARYVELPDDNQNQRDAALDGGLAVPADVPGFAAGDLDELRVYPGDVNGDPVADGTATHQYLELTQGAVTVRYRFADGVGLQREDCDAGGTCTWSDPVAFNGVIWVDGEVRSLTGPTRDPAGSPDAAAARPAFASFAQLTLATDDDVHITGDLVYEQPPCDGFPTREGDGSVTTGSCDDLEAENIFGVYSQNGDVRIGNRNPDPTRRFEPPLLAPVDVVIHGVLMSGTGVVTVDGYDRIAPRGAVNLLGGIIEESYGAFGTFSASTGANRSGYGRRIKFDERTEFGLAPPYFPTVGNDDVQAVFVFSYGQREQLY